MSQSSHAADEPVRILILDDEPEIVEELQEYLTTLGYDCEGVTSTAEARQRFLDDTDIGIILTDVKMPQEDGIRFVDWLVRQHEDDRVFEAVIFTGHGSHEKAVQALRAGVRDYFQKPLDLDQVAASVERLRERVIKRRQARTPTEIVPQLDALGSSLSELSNDLSALRRRLGVADTEPAPDRTATPSPIDNPAFDRLTARQKQVVELVANAYSNYQIAYELGITENTVKLYVSQILHTLGFSNRTQLALAATRAATQPQTSRIRP